MILTGLADRVATIAAGQMRTHLTTRTIGFVFIEGFAEREFGFLCGSPE
jgi:hypothetical protein